MNVAERLVEILEENGITHIFGIPGEQIMPMYKALADSDITHVLTRHEQAAAHAADAFTRTSDTIGVCMATAAPGALNLVMATAAAYKDNIPMLILTGDNDLDKRDKNMFQSLPLREVFANVTYENYSPLNGTEAIYALKAALYGLKNNPKGPIHINLSRDVLLSEDFQDFDLCYLCESDMSSLESAQELIMKAEKPLFVLGAGAIPQAENIKMLAEMYQIPVTTTYNARGIIAEDEPINLGLVGIRGTPRARKAIEESDCIIVLGSIASERTFTEIDEDRFIHVNINKDVLKGKYQIQGDVEEVIMTLEFKKVDWIDELLAIDNEITVEGVDDEMKPQAAIKRILECFDDNIIVADAGSHTTWTTLFYDAKKPNHFLFPAATAPMGYSLPAGIGASIATGEKIIVINGDGDFQMNLQELATLRQNNLDVIVFILNNSEYGIIRQWQEDFYDMEAYQTDLANPDFLKLASSYGIDAVRITTLFDLEYFLEKDLKGPLVVEIKVDKENIPLPE
ncbi:MAG: thiamine pyrophosphate-binding protein [Methanobrevibacter sp.]|uniref:thiamine pyrophosphate-binding protein n=1 Tax=Methanobrevibacter sp. TaxID=66852 RepID=UPI0025FBCDB4|nr:thiamine pyrophosphate-binding protein [Methanobrevibacter sp.]MBR0270597.1 thiamine pyrophosphate-binding protein [Methanobrevibacter sp.]